MCIGEILSSIPLSGKNHIAFIYYAHTNLKFNIQKTKIMVSGPITSWQIDGERMETVTDSLQMVTAATKLKNAYSLEEKL